MSFDLDLLAGQSSSLPSNADIEAWAAREAHLSLRGDTQLWYENPATGVYAAFWFGEGGLSFNLNYNRPHFFGLEAFEVVGRLASAFDLLVSNPQADNTPEPFDYESLCRDWNVGNRAGISSIEAVTGQKALVMESRAAEALWRYCRAYDRLNSLDEYDPEEWFVPRLNPCACEGKAMRIAFVPKATTYVLPPCDLLMLKRESGEVVVIREETFRRAMGDHLVQDNIEESAYPGLWIIPEHRFDDGALFETWDHFHSSVEPDLARESVEGIAMDAFVSTGE